MKRFACFCLCLALLLPTLLLSVQAEEPTAQPYSAGTGLTTATRSHSYDDCVVDGGIYYLRNVYTGQYLDVDNAASADWTQVSTYTFHGGANQQFKFIYMGRGLYEIIPMHAGTRLHIYSDHELVIHAQNRNTEQKFRLQMVGNGVGVIYSQHGNFTRTLTWDQSNPNSVANKIYADLADKTQAQWVFERVNSDTCDSYAAFYIRNVAKNLYLDVHNEETVAGMVVHGYSFLAQANQEWKLVSYSDGGCCLQTSLQRDMALDYRGGHLTIHPDNNPSTQRFYISFEGFEEGTGRSLYRIGMEINGGMQYLTMRSQPDYATVHYYVEWSADATDLWAFEPVIVDAKDPRMLTLNTAASSSITAGYNELKYYTYRPTKTAYYKIEFIATSCFLESPASQVEETCEWDRYTRFNKCIVAVFMQANMVYYFPIRFSGVAGSEAGTYTIKIRETVFTGHSHYDFVNDIDMDADIVAIRDDCSAMGMSVVHKTYMTVARAKVETYPGTGYRDFDSDIFVYSGHGQQGCATYDGSNRSSSFDADDLPDMSNCELVIWDCCQSANKYFGSSLVSVSIERGAETVIGWRNTIDANDTLPYITQLFEGLCDGMNVKAASDAALSLDDIDQSSQVVKSIVIEGNIYNVLFDAGSNVSYLAAAAETTTVKNVGTSIINRCEYTLYAENLELGIKLYSRMIHGIPSDDYFIEFYTNGVLTDIKKSHFTMDDADIKSANEQYSQSDMQNINILGNNGQKEAAEYQFRCVNNKLTLVEKRVMPNDGTGRVVFYNVITGEAVLS